MTLAAKATYRQSNTYANLLAWEAADVAAEAAVIAYSKANMRAKIDTGTLK